MKASRPLTWGLALAPLLPATAAAQTQKPHMLLFLADDHRCEDCEVYGTGTVRTPYMKQVAGQGLTFNRAFVASPASGPSRSALLSGLMPARNGAEANHVHPRAETQIMVRSLQEAGYEVVGFGKIAHGMKDHTRMQGFDQAQDAHREGIYKLVEQYLQERKSDKPLCLMVGEHRPHVPWIKKAIYKPEEVDLPDYLIDTPETRQHWARYLTDVTGVDDMMRRVDSLFRNYLGHEDYLFLYTADHGAQWPFGKHTLYDNGIRCPLIVRWPGKVPVNRRTEAMVSWIDLFPTLLDLVGGKIPQDIDGRSFLPVLLGKAQSHRSVIYTTHTADGDKNVYPIRSVREAQYKLIRNMLPDCYYSNHSDVLRVDGAGAYWDSWDSLARIDPVAKNIVDRFHIRPAVELYDVQKDPHELVNLAFDPQYRAQLLRLQDSLSRWMAAQNDTVRLDETPYPIQGPLPQEAVRLKQEAARRTKAQ